MLILRRLATVLLGAWMGGTAARALLEWALGLRGTWVLVAILVATVLGGLASLDAARKVEPMAPGERRDAILGWGVVVALVGVAACFALPVPWAVIAAAAVVGLAIVALRPFAVTLGQRAGLGEENPG
jgi:hypothetical protein